MGINKRQTGFTIVELLIVIVVIGILAAIVIVAYNGVQNRANDTAVQSDLSTLSKKIEIFKIDSPTGSYPYGAQFDTVDLPSDTVDTSISRASYLTDASINYNLLNCTNSGAPGTDYAFLAISKSGKRLWIGSTVSGVQEYTGPTAWGPVTACTSVLAGSAGNGAGYSTASGWRGWTN